MVYSMIPHGATMLLQWALGGALARRARAQHLFLTIPQSCLFLPPTSPHLTKHFGVSSRRV